MAVTLKFKRASTELSLQDGATGFQLAEGWRPVVQVVTVGGAPDPVVESLPVEVTGASQDDLATHVQALHEMQMWAALYMSDRMEQTPVWLHAQMTEETNQRRALVYGIETAYDSGWYEAESACYMQTLIVTVTRGPWESIAELATNGILAESAGMVLAMDYTAAPGADVTGDLPARISSLLVATEEMTTASDQYDRFWIGLRSARRHGTLANFVPVWECESATAVLGTDAALAADGTASPTGGGNTKVTVTPGTATWAKRLAIRLTDVTANPSDNYGRFLELLRAKVSAGAWECQLKWAYANGEVAGEGPIVEVNGTGWGVYEMGQQGIPQRDLHAIPLTLVADEGDLLFQVQIWARRTDGSGTLDLDCLVHLPVDEGYCVAKGADLDYDEGLPDSAYLIVGCAPEESCSAVGLTPVGGVDVIKAIPQLTMGNFYLPPGDGRAYIVYAGPVLSAITDKISATITWFPRWLSLRGAE